MTHNFQKKQIANLVAQRNPQPEKPPEPEEPEESYAGLEAWDIPDAKLKEAVRESDEVSLVLFFGANPRICELHFLPLLVY
jgi:hypothetical protein